MDSFKIGHFYRLKDAQAFKRADPTNIRIASDIEKAKGVFKAGKFLDFGISLLHVNSEALPISPENWLEYSEYKYFEEVIDPRASQKKVIDRKGIDLSSVFDKVILRLQQDNLEDITEDEYPTYVGVLVKSEIRKEQSNVNVI